MLSWIIEIEPFDRLTLKKWLMSNWIVYGTERYLEIFNYVQTNK